MDICLFSYRCRVIRGRRTITKRLTQFEREELATQRLPHDSPGQSFIAHSTLSPALAAGPDLSARIWNSSISPADATLGRPSHLSSNQP